MQGVLLLLLLLPLARPVVAGPSGDGGGASWRWRRVPVTAPGQSGGLMALALRAGEPGRNAVAVGHAGGVSLRVGDGPFELAARTGPVRDLAFEPGGSLWIASLAGLWHWSREGQLSERSPAPGERAGR